MSFGVVCLLLIAALQLGTLASNVWRRDWPQVLVYGGFLLAQGGLIWIALQRGAS
jgi:hypothetical protein